MAWQSEMEGLAQWRLLRVMTYFRASISPKPEMS